MNFMMFNNTVIFLHELLMLFVEHFSMALFYCVVKRDLFILLNYY